MPRAPVGAVQHMDPAWPPVLIAAVVVVLVLAVVVVTVMFRRLHAAVRDQRARPTGREW
ncbi:MAG TPA: hypothetical protein VGU73_05910 [Acidimicrobiia bacterium]|nr:hypothetical protein [Acidimicrobiia bacterium]